MKDNFIAATYPGRKKDDLILITGAGGFIGGSLARYFHEQGFSDIRAVDKKPLPLWYQRLPGVENLCLDLSEQQIADVQLKGQLRFTTLQRIWAAWDLLKNTGSNACEAS